MSYLLGEEEIDYSQPFTALWGGMLRTALSKFGVMINGPEKVTWARRSHVLVLGSHIGSVSLCGRVPTL